MAERMDADAPRYQGTTIHGTIDGGPTLQISDCQEGSRGTVQRDLTISITTVHAIIADFSEENGNNPMFTQALLFRFLDFAAAQLGNVSRFFLIRLRADRIVPCQRIVILYSNVLIYICIIAEKSIPVLFIIVCRDCRITFYNYDINCNYISRRLEQSLYRTLRICIFCTIFSTLLFF